MKNIIKESKSCELMREECGGITPELLPRKHEPLKAPTAGMRHIGSRQASPNKTSDRGEMKQKTIWKYVIDFCVPYPMLVKFMYFENMIDYLNRVKQIYILRNIRVYKVKDAIRYVGKFYITKEGRRRVRF